MGSADDGQTLSTAELAREVATLRNALAERDARLAAAEARVAEAEGESEWRRAKMIEWRDTAKRVESDRDRLAAANAELQAEIDRINDAQAASLGAEINRLAAENAAQAREIERLREIVDRLPKTADGVPIVPGMEVYVETDDDGLQCDEVVVKLAAYDVHDLPEFWFSTEAAALAPAADASGEVTP